MHPRPPSPPASFWTPSTLVAIAVATLALAAALAAYISIARAERLADAVAVQRSVAEAFEARALRCLDRSQASLDDPAGADRAERSLNISGGITLCLVGAREDARLDRPALDACIRDLEAANMVPGASADGAAFMRPAC